MSWDTRKIQPESMVLKIVSALVSSRSFMIVLLQCEHHVAWAHDKCQRSFKAGLLQVIRRSDNHQTPWEIRVFIPSNWVESACLSCPLQHVSAPTTSHKERGCLGVAKSQAIGINGSDASAPTLQQGCEPTYVQKAKRLNPLRIARLSDLLMSFKNFPQDLAIQNKVG